jgi:hypothetical protein
MFQQHVSRRHVKGAVKVTRKALNRALDAAEPKLESAAANLEDFSRDAYKTLRKNSLARLDDIKDGYAKIEKRVVKQLPPVSRRKQVGKIALVAAGVAVVAFGLFR